MNITAWWENIKFLMKSDNFSWHVSQSLFVDIFSTCRHSPDIVQIVARGQIFSRVRPLCERAGNEQLWTCERPFKNGNWGIFSHKSLTKYWVVNELCRTNILEKISLTARYVCTCTYIWGVSVSQFFNFLHIVFKIHSNSVIAIKSCWHQAFHYNQVSL
jgi:hypothetical protein